MTSPFRIPSSCEEGHWKDNTESMRWLGKDWHFPPEAPKPRACSFCGGAHAEDVIALLQLGWKHVRDPSPPAKLYSNHVTEEQYAIINSLVAINRAKSKT